MKQTIIYLFTITLILLGSCANRQERIQFPEEKELSEYKKTEFLPTLENQLNNNKNSIYCVTLLYAWEKIKETIQTPLHIDSTLYDLNLLNKSNSFPGVLKPEEYSTTTTIYHDSIIQATANFKKSLPFEEQLESFNDKLFFDGVKVASLGSFGNNSEISILYYKNDRDFILKLSPKDTTHEIIIYMPDIRLSSMAEILSEIENKINLGKVEIQQAESNWKYRLDHNDMVIIPELNFNIKTNYLSLKDNRFQSTNKKYRIENASQTTAFVLNKKGAEIKSDAQIVVTIGKIEEKKQLKRMIFDKPFFLMAKRRDAKYPYLGIWITNTELMIKE